MKPTPSIEWARGERIACPCCGRKVHLNRDGSIRKHRALPAHDLDQGHVCWSRSEDSECGLTWREK